MPTDQITQTPPQGVSLPSTTVQPPVVKPTPGMSKFKLALIILIILAIISVLGSASYATYYFYNQAKLTLKSNANSQATNLNNLQQKYSNIVTLLQADDQASESNTQEKFLKVSDIKFNKSTKILPNILGIESSPYIQQQRQFIEAVKDARLIDDQIIVQDDLITNSNNFFNRFLPSTAELVSKTNQMANSSSSILNYYEKSTEINIKILTAAYQWGVALQTAINSGGGPESTKSLDEQISNIEGLYNNFKQLPTENIPQALKTSHQKVLDQFQVIITSLKNANNAVVARDPQSLANAVLALSNNETAAQSEVMQVESISFWQNDSTIRSVETLKTDWQNFANSI